jgi:hypothetical protein
VWPTGSGARIMSFKIMISTTWNWAPGFGFISADVSFYFDGSGFYNATTTITSATGDARVNLGIGQPVIADGYVAIPIYSVNSNGIYAKLEGAPSFAYSTVGWGPWVSVAYPGAAIVNVPGDMTVGGSFTSSNYIQTFGGVYATGDVTAYYSDVRLKENIKPIENAIDKLNKISGYTYTANDLALDLKAAENKNQRIGVLAQEIKEVFPELIAQAPFDRNPSNGESLSGENYMTVKYERLVPVLIQAIKEQQLQIEELKSIVNGITK